MPGQKAPSTGGIAVLTNVTFAAIVHVV